MLRREHVFNQNHGKLIIRQTREFGREEKKGQSLERNMGRLVQRSKKRGRRKAIDARQRKSKGDVMGR